MPNIEGVIFGPPGTALLVPALRSQKFAIAPANERQTAFYEADDSAAQMVCFPGTIGDALLAEQSLCDAAIGRTGEMRGGRAKGCA